MAKSELTPESIAIARHSLSHILAKAVMELFPGTKLAIGPAIDNGFYYDFDTEKPLTEADFPAITDKMTEIIKRMETFERRELSRQEALEIFKDQPYKVELIEELPEDETISMYFTGDDFTDLCRGPHVENSRDLLRWAFQLMSVTGAYWRGNEKNKMLQRVYVYAFPDKKELKAYITEREEAKKRDHNKLGRELEYFTTVDYIGQGLPIILPKGTTVIRTLQRFVEDEEERRGYLQTKTPMLAKRELYKISGHWDHYRDGMFVMGDPEKWEDENEEILALRPMTCPFQFQAYLNRMRSYRDLPLRYNETSTLFRNEASGEMHGLIRVRQFTISEGHLACRPDQLEDEFRGCLELAQFMLETLGLDDDVSYRFSKWDENDKEKYIGDKSEWEAVQGTMRTILDDIGIDYTEEDGEAAFYGPKLDIQIKNVFGKEDTLITIQIDFQLAERFGMEYVDTDGQKKYPYVIHRTSIGCYERTLALIIEKYAGALPPWLMPEQVRVLTITDNQNEYANSIVEKLRNLGIRAKCDDRNEKIGFKIREARTEKLPYILVVGDKEIEENAVAVRTRTSGDLGAMPVDEFITKLMGDISTRSKTTF
ncbi:MAG: threonine--tRNA ligase [Clostridia bacterium]|nr:threonine--tRNA ligase [Oscillospiraceae bacterium]MBQ6796987.1 threonine--tRNA ligase [Clostridia bacterium]